MAKKAKKTKPAAKKTKASSKKTYVVLIIGIVLTILCWRGYMIVFSDNVFLKHKQTEYLFAIPTGSNVTEIAKKLSEETNVKDASTFTTLANLISLNSNIHPGLYKLKNSMSNLDIVLLFRSGRRQHVKLTIRFERYASDVAKMVAPKLEANYEEMLALLNDSVFLDSLGFTKETAICLFIPDTYEMNWNISARTFLTRMDKEYKLFWDEERLAKAKALGLTPQQVMTVASIINQESNKNDEKPRIAGVYLNRLKQNMPLQADPTVKYAVGDFTLKRIRKGHLLKDSPYNTYKNKGLPPGPICIPDKVDIDAVLNREQHGYVYFCARPDYSGYHKFAKTYTEHLKFAHEYSAWLDKEGIQ